MARLTWNTPTGSGRRAGWARTIEAVDSELTRATSIEGHYLKNGVEIDLPVDSLVLEVAPEGSVKNGWQSPTVFKVTAEGTLEQIGDSYDWYKQKLSLRDHIQETLDSIAKRRLLKTGDLESLKSYVLPQDLLNMVASLTDEQKEQLKNML